MLDFIKKNKACSVFAVFNIGLFALLASSAPILSPDSNGYIQGSLLRGPGYPLLLAFGKLLLGRGFLFGAVAVQTAVALFGVIWLSLGLKKYFRLPTFVFVLAYLALVWPLLPLKGGFVGAQIMTEALAYGMLLCAVACLLRGLFEKDNRFFLFFLLLSSAGVLVKPQFIFVPVAAALITVARFLSDRDLRKAALCLGVLFVSLAACLAGERVYHYVRHGAFAPAPGLGFNLGMNALFLADDESSMFYTVPEQRALFDGCYAAVKAAGLRSVDFKGQGVASYAAFYSDSFNLILWQLMLPALDAACSPGTAGTAACMLKKEAAAASLGKIFFRHKPARLVKLIAYKFLAKAPLDYWFFVSVLFVLSGCLFIRLALPAAGFLWAGLVLHFMNCCAISLLSPITTRLIFSTEMLCAALFVSVSWQCYEKFSRKEEPETI